MRFFATLFAACALSVSAFAAPDAVTNTSPTLKVGHGWVRWLPNERPAAAYMVLKNRGAQSIEFISASSSDYAHVSLHQSVVQDGKSKMMMVKRLPIPAHGEVSLKPGGYHLMLEQPKHEVAPGDMVGIELHFSDGTTLRTQLPVRPPASK